MREDYLALFPVLREIQNEDWRQAACGIYGTMLQRSGWAQLEDVPFTLKGDGGTLVEHTRATMRSALRIAGAVQQVYPDKAVDRDIMLLAAFLHDVSKILEYGPDGRTLEGAYYQHAFLAAHEALNAGLPAAVVSIIMLHTPQSNVPQKFLEGVIVQHAEAAMAAAGVDYRKMALEALQ